MVEEIYFFGPKRFLLSIFLFLSLITLMETYYYQIVKVFTLKNRPLKSGFWNQQKLQANTFASFRLRMKTLEILIFGEGLQAHKVQQDNNHHGIIFHQMSEFLVGHRTSSLQNFSIHPGIVFTSWYNDAPTATIDAASQSLVSWRNYANFMQQKPFFTVVLHLYMKYFNFRAGTCADCWSLIVFCLFVMNEIRR